MRTLIIATLLLAFGTLSAQRSVVIEKRDSTFRLVEYTIVKNDTLSKSVFTNWLSTNDLLKSIYTFARQAEANIEKAETQKTIAKSEFGYYKSTLDTLMGAGSYDKAVVNELQQAIQGKWKVVDGSKQYTVLIEGTTLSGWKDGTAVVKDDKTLLFESSDKIEFKLTNGTFVAKVGEKTYYLIR